ncbi:MAG: molybdate ABC transporter permease subunit, partial [Candidatus Dormiibacterota bacterium]
MAELTLSGPARRSPWTGPRRVLGPGMAVGYLSLLVLLPLAALLSNAFTGGIGTFWQEVTQPES